VCSYEATPDLLVHGRGSRLRSIAAAPSASLRRIGGLLRGSFPASGQPAHGRQDVFVGRQFYHLQPPSSVRGTNCRMRWADAMLTMHGHPGWPVSGSIIACLASIAGNSTCKQAPVRRRRPFPFSLLPKSTKGGGGERNERTISTKLVAFAGGSLLI